MEDTATCSTEEGSSPDKVGQDTSASSSSLSTPGDHTPRKNKRKMSEPRKRADVCVKRFRDTAVVSRAELYDDDDDDDTDLLGVEELPSNTPEPSPSSDERENSTGTGPSSSPVLLPLPPGPPAGLAGFPAQLLTAAGLPAAMFQSPILTSVGGMPRYALFPGFPTGFLPPGGLLSPDPRLAGPGLGAPLHSTPRPPSPDSGATSQDGSPLECPSSVPSPSPSVSSALDFYTPTSASDLGDAGSRKQRKNYKNMTRERRVEANARERTRVHTISAAFESLRRAVPSYSYHQRLSKLAILRIACSYILALSRLADMDYSEDQDALSFPDCVELCTQTIQSEGRSKRGPRGDTH